MNVESRGPSPEEMGVDKEAEEAKTEGWVNVPEVAVGRFSIKDEPYHEQRCNFIMQNPQPKDRPYLHMHLVNGVPEYRWSATDISERS